jgi:hypothetical protein
MPTPARQAESAEANWAQLMPAPIETQQGDPLPFYGDDQADHNVIAGDSVGVKDTQLSLRSSKAGDDLPIRPKGSRRSYISDSGLGLVAVRESQNMRTDATAAGVAHSPGNMFADADNARAAMLANIAKKDYDVTDYYHEEGCWRGIATSSHFGNFTLAVIGINALWMGLDAECNDDSGEVDLSHCPMKSQDWRFWTIGENIFCTFFTFEWLSRFMAFKKKISAVRDHWFKFDSVLVFMMVIETWIIPIAAGGSSDSLNDFALLRMMRLLRLTRMVRLMRSVPELLTLFKGMKLSARSVTFTLFLLLIITYIFGIVFTSQLVNPDDPRLEKLFKTIPNSMWTLFFVIVFGPKP